MFYHLVFSEIVQVTQYSHVASQKSKIIRHPSTDIIVPYSLLYPGSSPVNNVVIFSSPTEHKVWKSVDSFHLLQTCSETSAKEVVVRHSKIHNFNIKGKEKHLTSIKSPLPHPATFLLLLEKMQNVRLTGNYKDKCPHAKFRYC